jgi:uncharacterized membrane protein
MFDDLGGFFGGIIVVLYFLSILNYVVKFINKKFRTKLMKNEKLYQAFTKFMKFIIKKHKLFGMLTVAFILLHFSIQFTRYGFSITGAIAATVLLLQVGLGIYGSKMKKRSKLWLNLHRSIAVLLLIVIGIHIL